MTNSAVQPEVLFEPFSKRYDQAYAIETEGVRDVSRPARVFIDHVGSTAVAGLGGKPVVDLLVSLHDWKDADRVATGLTSLGYIEQEAVSEPPRRFLIRSDGIESHFHLHLAPLGSDWGHNMLVFRDELAADQDLAERYATLKKRLSEVYCHDLKAYTSGKSQFVAEVLRKAAGVFAIDRLLTHQRAELDRSQAFQLLAILAQLGVAIVAAISVYSNDNRTQLNFAVSGFLLAAIWFMLARRQRLHRGAGDQARRVALLTSGLDARFSAEQRLRIFDQFTVSITGRRLQREERHFASRASPGYTRLAEMIEESAYWTHALQQGSAAAVQWILIALAALLGGAFWMGILSLPTDETVSAARVLVTILVFLLSSDIIGSIFAHRQAATSIAEILHRIETAAARGYPEQDVLLLMSDYNAAVEAAPFALPFIFNIRNMSLTRRWRNYLENKRER